ncbi:MAG TPA: TetR/AcrR family transcriptional regulator [Thermoleophilaceae bacterium]
MSPKAESKERTAGRRPGRPRSAEAHQAILTATLQVLIDQGYAQMSMERVAERAGVGKATIYRRWKNKSELVAEALTNLRLEEVPSDEGSLRADVLALSKRQIGLMKAQPRFPRLPPRLLAESADDPELHAIVRANLVDPIRSLIAELIRRAIERGEVRKDVELERVVDLLHGPIIYQFLMSGADMSAVTEDYAQSLLDILLPGLEPRAKRSRS